MYRGNLRGNMLRKEFLLSLLLAFTSCRTLPQMAPVDLAQPNWTVRQGQAVWQPQAGQAEMIGEVLVALHPAGDFLVEFSKAPFPVVSAQQRADRWQIRFALVNRTRRGSRAPPEPILWLQVASALQGRPVPPIIHTSQTSSNCWVLENMRTGERLTLVLDPP